MFYSKRLHRRMQVLLLEMLLTVNLMEALDFKYHNHDNIERLMKSWTEQFPDLAHMYSIGESVAGADLWVIVVGQNPSEHSLLVPNVQYIANMHGNEVVGRELLLHLAEHMLLQYGKNETITRFMNTTRVHLMPTMNPDGFAKSKEGGCYDIVGRGNAFDVDLNRNFPDAFAFGKVLSTEQKETLLVRDWIHSTNFVLSANLHGGALVVNYPFDAYHGDSGSIVGYSATPDDDIFRHLSLIYSRSHPTMHKGISCGDTFDEGITNGAKWYPIYGGMQDYMYTAASGYEILIEVSCCKYPKSVQLRGFWEKNKDALINLIFAVHMGVKGLILVQSKHDDNVFLPQRNAEVVIVGRESVIFQSTKYGEYFKLLLPGDYELKVSYPGYVSSVTPFHVQDSIVTRLDIKLFRNNSEESSASMTTVSNKTFSQSGLEHANNLSNSLSSLQNVTVAILGLLVSTIVILS